MSSGLASAESALGSVGFAGDEMSAAGQVALPGRELVTSSLYGLSHARTFLARTQTAGPALIVAMVLILTVGPGLMVFRGNPTGYVRFGREFVANTHPPAGAEVDTWTGYDGQFFWVLAQDPLLARPSTLAAFTRQGFRLGRIGYPALAYALAGGQKDAIPWSLLAVNLVAVVGLTLVFAAYARRRGWSGWWALGVGLLPGLQFVTMGDLSGAVAVAFMLGGLMAWERRKRWSAACLLAAAALTREPMLLTVVAIAIEETARWWPARRSPGALRRSVKAAWPVLTIPTVLFLAWQAYVQARLGSGTLPPTSAFQAPLVGLLTEVSKTLRGGMTPTGVWDLALLIGILAGISAAFILIRRTTSAPAVAAAMFGLVLLVLPFGSDWGYARESAPLFAALLLGGLDQRARPAKVICIAAALLGALMPLTLG